MAIKVTKIELGAFAAGAVPPDIIHTYLDEDGEVVDISAFGTRQMNIEAIPSVAGTLGSATVDFVTNGSDGKIKYAWALADMAEESSYEAQMWVSNGTKKFESDLLIYVVYDGPGSAP